MTLIKAGIVAPRPCERQCTRCGEWKHFSRFNRRTRRVSANSTVSASFDPICKDCRQKERNEKKNVDRPLAIVRQRAATRAHAAGVPLDFFWVQMNWQSLVPYIRAAMEPESRCISCGHPFLNERDIQFDHVEPPRSPTDWERHHARNIRILCGSCNRTHSDKPNSEWLTDQESARLSNASRPTLPEVEPPGLDEQATFPFMESP